MTRGTRTRFAWVLLALVAPALASCTDDKLAGTYTATTFTYAPAGSPAQNVLAAGGSIHLTIADDLSTGGSITIPAGVNGLAAGTTSLLGSSGQVGNTVTLNLIADTFLRDIQFSFGGTALSGSGTVSGGVVIVILSK
jgi:hypothetical protein